MDKEGVRDLRRASEVLAPGAEQNKFERLLRFPAVQERVPYSHSTIYLQIKLGTFPKPVSLGGRAVAWRESEINQWVESRSPAPTAALRMHKRQRTAQTRRRSEVDRTLVEGEQPARRAGVAR